ncbi:MAG: GAF domain-containing protein [Anaerolineae bacterium]
MEQSKPRPLDRILLHLLLLRLFLPSFIVTLLAVGLTAYVRGRSLETQQLLLARSLAYTVDDYLEHASRVLGAVAQVAEASTPEELARYMQATWQSYGYFDTLYRLDESGRVALLAPPDHRHQGLDMSRQPYLRQASEQTNVTISEPFISPRTGQPAVYTVLPLADGGMMVGELGMGALREAIAAGREPGQYLVFVTDRTGSLLAHPQPDLVAQQVNVGDLEIVRRGLSGEATLPYSTAGTLVLGSATQVERTGWVVVVQTPLSVAYGPYMWAVSVALLLAPAVWLAVLLHLRRQLERRVVAPLARLSQGVDAVASGDFAQGAALVTIPAAFAEVGALAADFAHMSQAVQARQAALRASEERFRSVVQTASDAIITADSHGNIVFWNKAAEIVFGYSASETFGRPITAMMPERFHETYQTLIKRVASTGESSLTRKTVEMAGLRKDGSEFPLELSWATWNTGGETFLTGIVRDITERKRAEEALAQRAAQLALLNDIGGKIAAVLELGSVLDRAARLVQENFGYHHVALFALDRERGELLMKARAGDFAHLFPPDHHLKLGQGMVGWVGRHGKTLLANDVDAEPRFVNLYPDAIPTRSELSVPIRVGGEVVGVLDVQSPQLNAFSGNDVTVMETLADQIAVAIENARLYRAVEQELAERKQAEEALARHNRELALLNRASQAFSSTLDLDQVLATVLEEVCRLLNAAASSVWLTDSVTGELACRQATGPQSKIVRGWRLTPGEGIAGWVVRSGESLVVPDVQADERYFKGVDEQIGLGLRSMLAVPLRAKQDVVGVLEVMDTETSRFDTGDLALVESLATTAVIAIENARLYRELHNHAEQLEQRVQERTAQIQAQYAWLEAILSSASDGIIVTSAEGQIIQANPVAQAWLTQTLSPEDAARLREAVRNLAVRAEERPEEMLELKGLDLELSAAPVVGEREEEPVVVAVHDVSHLKALDRMKTRFVSNVSHELRTPVATIKLYAELMRRRPEKWEEYLATLTQEVDRQVRLVQDILQISRIDAGRLEMKPRPISLNELTEATAVNHQTLAQEHGLTLEHRPAEPGPVALVDPRRMMQVLNNLVENAIHYTPEGGKIVVSTGREKTEGRVWATAMVADTGMGIPEEELPHIFERFFRGKEVRLMQISGTGLGLAIVEEIVELHGGRVMVESQVGEGTTFTIRLPLAE